MKLTILGAAKQVSGSMSLFETDSLKILIDCGLVQTNNTQKDMLENIKPFNFNPSEIDYVIITHAHIDHCGLIPYLVKCGYTGPILCTEPTMNICAIALKDCAHIWEKELERAKKINKNGKDKIKLFNPIYTTDEAEYAMENFRGYGFNNKIVLDDKVSLTFRKAGHILGAASLEFDVQQEYKVKKVVFSGDISGKNDFHPFIEPVEYIDKADYLICESTYGDKKHIKTNVEEVFTNVITETCLKNHRTTLIASFSVQRLQEILWYLYKVYEEHPEFKNIPIYVDTPMGERVSKDVFARSFDFYNDEAKELINNGKNIFSWDQVSYVKEYTDSLALATGEPKIIISSAGMMQAGRITNHIESFLPSKNCTSILTGFCAIGTFGRKLLDVIASKDFEQGKTEIENPLGKSLKIKSNVIKIDGLSGHADSNDLIKYITHIKGLKQVILNHGEIDSLNILQGKLLQKINIPVTIANKNNTIYLK